MMWEIVEPLEGRTIYNDFLDEHGEGIHHVAFAGREEGGSEMPYGEQIAEFVKRGFPVIQSGLLKDVARFHYFDTEEATSTTFEIYSLKGRDLPEPDEWFPAPPRRDEGQDLTLPHCHPVPLGLTHLQQNYPAFDGGQHEYSGGH